jgi:LPS-assembly protein
MLFANVHRSKSSNLDLVDGLTQPVTGVCISRSNPLPRVRRSLALRLALLSISTTLALAGHQQLRAQEVTNQEPPSETTAVLPSAPSPQQQAPFDLSTIARATLLPSKPPEVAILESDTQSKHGDIYLLAGDVVITYGDHVLRADTATYDADSGEATVQGHVRLTGGDNDEYIKATHGTYNVRESSGTFYDVNGSIGLGNTSRRPGYQSTNPFLFSGRKVVETSPEHYDVYDGAVTSCLLPRPDWQLFSEHFQLNGDKAKASNSVFHLLGIPLLPLPYVTQPTNTNRQSGILIPALGYSSASQNTGSKGLTVGEQGYLTLGRSADLTVGMLYYSLRGFSENGTVRYRGPGDDFFTAHFSALQDRGFDTPTVNAQNQPITLYVNQGGQDITSAFRWKLSPTTRFVGDGEYLSSYVYREVFTENFNQAVSSDITSTVYLMNQKDGYSTDFRLDRYQGLKVVPILTRPGEEVKVFHAPSIDFSADDHHIPGTPLLWSLNASAAGLKRVQPNFVTSGIIERLDFRPEISLPLHFDGWNIFASAAARESFYSRSRRTPYSRNPANPYPANATPIEITDPANRADAEITVDIRPPVLERTFEVPANWQWLLGKEVRHTLEPEITYRDVAGVNNFLSILRFDDVDLASDTNELDYSMTQRLFFRPRPVHMQAIKPRPGCSVKPASQSATTQTAIPREKTEEPSDDNPETGANPVDPVQQPTNDANGIPNASATAPDQPTRTHAHHADPCAPSTTPALPPQQEWFSWKIEQKYFFDTTFGNAVINTGRNIFDTTLNLSGIAFLTEPRNISPIISRLRFRTSGHTDFEWDLDYDTGAKKINSSNVFLDLHEGRYFGALSYALLNAPGRFYTEVVNPTTNSATGLTSSAISNFSQMRLLSGYGTPNKPGISAAAGAGIDLNAGSGQDTAGPLQYLTIQASYNWNCCGLSVEYRKYDLGAIRNEGVETFNFTLANIGSAGNLRRNQSLF